IRASEGSLYHKLTQLFATSVDYDPDHPLARRFFATVQNKLHAAITGHTAAELIARRADATQPQMGLTTWRKAPEGRIGKADVAVAKNYLTGDELTDLGLLVEQLLSYAELQARRGNAMRMADWNTRLDEFLKWNGYPVLEGAGRVSAAQAKARAARELAK